VNKKPLAIKTESLVRGLDQKLAALFGTTYDKIVVNDLVVHQPSHQLFISVERGRGTDAVPAIVKVNHGNLEVVELDRIPHSQVASGNVQLDHFDKLRRLSPSEFHVISKPRVINQYIYAAESSAAEISSQTRSGIDSSKVGRYDGYLDTAGGKITEPNDQA
jgi:hypothetical protein